MRQNTSKYTKQDRDIRSCIDECVVFYGGHVKRVVMRHYGDEGIAWLMEIVMERYIHALNSNNTNSNSLFHFYRSNKACEFVAHLFDPDSENAFATWIFKPSNDSCSRHTFLRLPPKHIWSDSLSAAMPMGPLQEFPLTELETLDLRGVLLQRPLAQAFDHWELVEERCPNLTFLDVGNPRGETHAKSISLATLCVLPKTVQHFGLSAALNRNTLATWRTALAKRASCPPLPGLTSLDLSENEDLSDQAAIEILRIWPKLKQIDMSGNVGMGDMALECFTLTGQLESLACGHCAITDSGLASAMQKSPNLTHLTLSNTNIGDLSLWAIGLSCAKLESFVAANCLRVTDASLEALIRGCSKSISHLDVSGTGVLLASSSVVAAILSSPIRFMSLQGCNDVRDDALRIIGKAKPHLRSSKPGPKGSLMRLVAGLPLGRRWGLGTANAERAPVVLLDALHQDLGLSRAGNGNLLPLREMHDLPIAVRSCANVKSGADGDNVRQGTERIVGTAQVVQSKALVAADENIDGDRFTPQTTKEATSVHLVLSESKMRRTKRNDLQPILQFFDGRSDNHRVDTSTNKSGKIQHILTGSETLTGGSKTECSDSDVVESDSNSDWSEWSDSGTELESPVPPKMKEDPEGSARKAVARTKLGFGTRAVRF